MRIRVEGSVKELRELFPAFATSLDGAPIAVSVAGHGVGGTISRVYFVDGGVMIDLHEPPPAPGGARSD